ncbi:hypothetical protein [Streptomyces griseosporeus]|uniref:hypothetical protein n=1 Tax=Streptomyces griseosporeus TaxID=1910 RepID=UPI0036F56AE0
MNAPTTMQWIRNAAQRLAVGSGRLAAHLAARTVHRGRSVWRRAADWLGEGEGLSWLLRLAVLVGAAALLRKIATALAAALYARVHAGAVPWLMWGTATAWVVAAYRCGADDWEPKQSTDKTAPADGEQPAAAEEQPAAEQAPTGPPPVSPAALVAAVRDIGTPHAQLKPLAEHLGTTTDAVRAAAQRMAWAVKDVRMKGRSSAAGLRWDEAPSPAEVYPSPSVVGAGQRADDNDDDTHGSGPEEGVRVVRTDGGLIVYDLADTHRRRGVVGQ